MTLKEKLEKKIKEKQEQREKEGAYNPADSVEVENYNGTSLKGKAGSGK